MSSGESKPGASGPRLAPASWDRLVAGALYRYEVPGEGIEEEGWLATYEVDPAGIRTCFVARGRTTPRWLWLAGDVWRKIPISEVRMDS